MKKIIFIFLTLVYVGTAVAQDSGQISYSLTFDSDDDETKKSLPMFYGSTMNLYFVPNKTRIDMNMGQVMKMTNIVDMEANEGLVLMEMMGNFIATKVTSLAEKSEEKKEVESEVEVTGETKKIIGFTCKKVIVKNADGDEIIVWIATDLKSNLKGQKQFSNLDVEGVPLEFSVEKNGMTITFIATEYISKVNKKLFKMKIPGKYTVIPEDQLEQ